MNIGSTTEPKARKTHVCSWCGEDIIKGEKYKKYSWLDEGYFVTVKMHNECYVAAGDWGDEFTVGEFSRGCCCENGYCECN